MIILRCGKDSYCCCRMKASTTELEIKLPAAPVCLKKRGNQHSIFAFLTAAGSHSNPPRAHGDLPVIFTTKNYPEISVKSDRSIYKKLLKRIENNKKKNKPVW